jgi:predicted nicotinamide N-methyase
VRPFSRDEATAFVRAQTALAATPLLPEIRLHLATEITPLWQATEAELAVSGLPPPYWAFAWVGGQALARHVLDRPELVRGKRVLDFAAGSGVTGIAAALAGAARVEASELDPLALAALALNAAANGVTIAATGDDLTAEAPKDWDVVLAGDVCYERPMAERVVPWLRRAAAQGALVLLGDPGRAYLPKEGLVEQARYTVPTTRELEDRDSREVTIHRLLAA